MSRRTTFARRIISFFITVMLVFAASLTFFYYAFGKLMQPVDAFGNGATKTVTIVKGANSSEIGSLLADQGLIHSSLVFSLYVKYMGQDGMLKAGEYSFNTGLSTKDIIEQLAKGENTQLNFTIPEGFTLEQIADKLAQKGLVNRERFLDIAANGSFPYDFLQDLKPGPARLEGFLFPDTYRISAKTDEKQIINMMLARFVKEITPEFKTKAAKNGMNVRQAVILASIIEREAKLDKERPKVAAVFLNRLKKGWKLESCATVQYALGTPKARLFDKDLRIDSPYNTYKYPGLPAGPIASPGSPSLMAAVDPANVNYMFFVVDEKGEHIFSRTLKEHLRNRDAYLKRLES